MPVSSTEKDYILRMIQQVMQMVARLMGRKKDGDLQGALDEARAATGQLLGPMADVAPRVDSVTAGHMVGDPDVLAAWARVVAEEADVHRLMGDAAGAAARERRALELALEAFLRFVKPTPEVLALIGELRPLVDASALDPRHRDALASLPASSG